MRVRDECHDKKQSLSVIDDYVFRKFNPCVVADYRDGQQELEENASNPMILALPAFVPRDEVIAAMKKAFAVPHMDTWRQWPLVRKILGIEHVLQVLVTCPEHLELYDWMHVTLRHRYRDAVPTAALAPLMQKNYEASQALHATVIRHPGKSHSRCHSIIGLSGAGKTTLMAMVLSIFPMMIEHREFADVPAYFVQVTWLVVSCPSTGSVETLMQLILQWFDDHLPTHYVDEMPANAKIGRYIKKVHTVLKRHMVGFLIIDEFQFALKAAKKTGIVDFLTNFFNEDCCAYILIGTPEVRRIIGTLSMRDARRTISGGKTELSPYRYGREWCRFVDELIRIDFLPCAPADIRPIRKALYEVSAGLSAFAKLAWEITQYVGLRAGYQAVTPELVRQSVADTFSPVSGLIDALLRRDYTKLVGLEDMAIEEVEKIKAVIERQFARRDLEAGNGSVEVGKVFALCVAMLVDLGKPVVEAETEIRDILQTHPGWTAQEVMKKALVGGHPSGKSPASTRKVAHAPAKNTRTRRGLARNSAHPV
ncbi:ATP-binding protein [Paraburkholderia sp. MM5482-R1]|uniref:ATP-binding protein n=1 Tax=unclassified Paraburkholderia TaxID=2615204 RepID=UPI003D232B26